MSDEIENGFERRTLLKAIGTGGAVATIGGMVTPASATTTDSDRRAGQGSGSDSATASVDSSLARTWESEYWSYKWELSSPRTVVVELVGPDDADFDLYVSEGTASCPIGSHSDQQSWSKASKGSITLDDPDSSTDLRILVSSHEGSGRYTLTVTERSSAESGGDGSSAGSTDGSPAESDGDGSSSESDGDGSSTESDEDGSSTIHQIERNVHQEVNRQRKNNGKAPVSYDTQMASVARKHSQDMIDRDYFSHVAPEDDSFADHYNDEGISCNGLGENILYRSIQGSSPEEIAANIVEQWWSSDSHRRNILGTWKTEGIGIAITDDDVLYATEGFGNGC
ncbi:CAP domain-containing protein [Halocatena marina]|uniref:CAP domain-containing protein n=1 Tax=Halocatena marina TaxID=2934937 RepID=A0ABD5YPR2_9EURY|nr:CAP domain-containing protein [Halocatena marina]